MDLDPQGNATSGVGLDRQLIDRSVYDALVGGAGIMDLIQPTPVDGFSIIPSSRDLAGVEVELVPLAGRERRLARSSAPLQANSITYYSTAHLPSDSSPSTH